MGRPAHFSYLDDALYLSRLKPHYSTIYRSINLLLTVALSAYSMLSGETTDF